MRYLRVVEDQGRCVASLPETLPPTPTRGEVLIRVTASGVNRADLSQIAGRYPPPAGESEILGLEVSGTLDETGEPVCALLAGGGHAECVAAPVGQVFPAPAGLDLVTAAGIPEALLTAFVNLIVEGGLGRRGRAVCPRRCGAPEEASPSRWCRGWSRGSWARRSGPGAASRKQRSWPGSRRSCSRGSPTEPCASWSIQCFQWRGRRKRFSACARTATRARS